jgi:hypothetical protein
MRLVVVGFDMGKASEWAVSVHVIVPSRRLSCPMLMPALLSMVDG